MTRPRAADDFAIICARFEELRAPEARPAGVREWPGRRTQTRAVCRRWYARNSSG